MGLPVLSSTLFRTTRRHSQNLSQVARELFPRVTHRKAPMSWAWCPAWLHDMTVVMWSYLLDVIADLPDLAFRAWLKCNNEQNDRMSG